MLKDLSVTPPEVGSFQDYVSEEINSVKEYMRRNVREEKRSFVMSERDLEMMSSPESCEHYMKKRMMDATIDLMHDLINRGIIKNERRRDYNGANLVCTVSLNVCRDPDELISEVESMMEGLEQVYEEL